MTYTFLDGRVHANRMKWREHRRSNTNNAETAIANAFSPRKKIQIKCIDGIQFVDTKINKKILMIIFAEKKVVYRGKNPHGIEV